MRHNIAGNRLSRNSTLRKATVRDLAKATLLKERIQTTKARAKEARKLVDKLITMGKSGTLADKRRAFAILCNHGIVSDLFTKTAPRFKNRVGGYTRIIPLGNRRGDNAELVLLELTEKEVVAIKAPKVVAASKGKDPKVQANVTDAQIVEVADGTDAPKESGHKNEVVKTPTMKPTPQDKAKGKNIMGNIRTMFNRKTGGGQ